MHPSVIVVPCYNEEHRLPVALFERAATPADVSYLFVDDGSTDRTSDVLQGLASRMSRVRVIRLDRNRGKAEAVRQGLRAAIAAGAMSVGYLDADLATPLPECFRLLDVAEQTGRAVVLGARVRLLGSDVRRNAVRHYLGRCFATLASLLLRMPVYDTQCGAKVFRVSPALRSALADPFVSRWAFDVELIGRLRTGTADVPGLAVGDFIEVPLQIWRDVHGSKVRPTDVLRVGAELLLIASDLEQRRRAAGRKPVAT